MQDYHPTINTCYIIDPDGRMYGDDILQVLCMKQFPFKKRIKIYYFIDFRFRLCYYIMY